MAQKKTIRVLIVDDHAGVRRALSIFLEEWDDLELAGEADNGKTALDLVERLHPDVVLMDLVMPVMDGIQATQAIREAYPDVQVIVLTSTIDFDMINKAIEVGAFGYMLKDVLLDTIAETIRAAVR
jgi:two-component system, NarL family, response regulator LiaR